MTLRRLWHWLFGCGSHAWWSDSMTVTYPCKCGRERTVGRRAE